MAATLLAPTRVASFIDRQKASMIVGYVTLNLEQNYPTSGDNRGWDLTKAEVNPNLTTVYSYEFQPIEGYELIWDHANSKLRVWSIATGAEYANGADALHDVTAYLKYEGI